MAATPPPKRKPTATTPAVAMWVRVELNKRVKRNRLLEDAPAVVSRVDTENSTINLLFPNKLSVFFHDRGQSSTIMFAIETHPIAKVLPWEGPTKHLDKILIHALLHFAEARAPALMGHLQLRAVAAPLHQRQPDEGPSSEQAESIKMGLRSIEPDDVGEHPNPTREMDSPVAEETPARAASSSQAAGAALDDDGETPPKIMAPAKPAHARSELPEFTKRVSEIFRRRARDALSKEELRDELAEDFPNWEALMARLDSQNKVCVVEDAVMLIQ